MKTAPKQMKTTFYSLLEPKERSYISTVSKEELNVLEKFLGVDATHQFLRKKSPQYLENLKLYMGQTAGDDKLQKRAEEIIAEKTIVEFLTDKKSHLVLLKLARILGDSRGDRLLRKRIEKIVEDRIEKRLLVRTALLEKTRIYDYIEYLYDTFQQARIRSFMNNLEKVNPIVYSYFEQQYNRFLQKRGLVS